MVLKVVVEANCLDVGGGGRAQAVTLSQSLP